MNIQEGQFLHDYVTMRIGGPATYVITATSEVEVAEAAQFARDKNLPLVTLGTGSNVIFSDAGFNGVILINKILGTTISDDGTVVIGGGGDWDEAVEQTVNAGFAGIEALSLIPGTVGAAPVNNIGAYGQQISDTLVNLRAYDTKLNSFVTLTNTDCDFSYRNSRFKTTDHGRFIITALTLQLKPAQPTYIAPTYGSLNSALQAKNITAPTIYDVRETVIEIRGSKLPEPTAIANCGSFFKLPIVSQEKAATITAKYPGLPTYQSGDNIKLSAGWMIEHAGLKGYTQNGMRVYEKQCLVLINDSATSYIELQNMVEHIQKTIDEKFGVHLEPEPELL